MGLFVLTQRTRLPFGDPCTSEQNFRALLCNRRAPGAKSWHSSWIYCSFVLHGEGARRRLAARSFLAGNASFAMPVVKASQRHIRISTRVIIHPISFVPQIKVGNSVPLK
ncbi:hypothetical protein COCOBI_13-4110 [Coccomyxa sp. Obi]|nr:hypothetical protein COCOBI_13-4110 [Coccomyxa sp. Obi]